MPDIVSAIEACGLVDPDDRNFNELRNFGSDDLEFDGQSARDVILNDIPTRFSRLQELLSGIEAQHLSIFKEIRQCDALLRFFRDNDYHSTEGERKFQFIRDQITLQMGNDHCQTGS